MAVYSYMKIDTKKGEFSIKYKIRPSNCGLTFLQMLEKSFFSINKTGNLCISLSHVTTLMTKLFFHPYSKYNLR